MQTIYVLIGAPACGKTQWALRNAKRLGAFILSADVVREAIRQSGGDPFDGDRVFAELGQRLSERLLSGDSVIVDATHWQRQYRSYAVSAARAVGARIVGVWFDVPLEVCLQRNDSRLGSSPGLRREDPETIRRIHVGLELPSIEEFDEIHRIQYATESW
ncbi:MAG TPA: ATP-binding protein [Anaerolineae bacterium]